MGPKLLCDFSVAGKRCLSPFPKMASRMLQVYDGVLNSR